MNKLVTALLVCLSSAHSWGASPSAACSTLWAELGQLKQSDQPLFTAPSVPAEGILPGLRMSALAHPDGTPFIPRSIEESNCYLERILDQPTRDAIIAGAKRAAWDRAAEDLEATLEALAREIDAGLRSGAGLPDAASGVAYSSIITNLQMLYGVRPSPVEDAGAFLRHAYAQGLYTGRAITSYILVSYIDSHGVAGYPVRSYVEHFRKRDASFAPPAKAPPQGCMGGIDYRWPHMTTPLPGQDDLPEEDNVHVGVCRSTGRVWSYHYLKGWRELDASSEPEICRLWGGEKEFVSVCARGSSHTQQVIPARRSNEHAASERCDEHRRGGRGR